MIKLTNLEKNENELSLNYEPINPDARGEVGYVKMDVRSREVIEEERTSFDLDFYTYWYHLRSYMEDICETEKDMVISETYIMWY